MILGEPLVLSSQSLIAIHLVNFVLVIKCKMNNVQNSVKWEQFLSRLLVEDLGLLTKVFCSILLH